MTSSLTVVVITNILEKLQRFRGTPLKVKRQVLLQHGELVCYVVLRRRRIRCTTGQSGKSADTGHGTDCCRAMMATDYILIHDILRIPCDVNCA